MEACKNCLMNSSADGFLATGSGCNFCEGQREKSNSNVKNFSQIVDAIKSERKKGRKYDCFIGVSGGVDSSMVLHTAVSAGLIPLVFNYDNGWNSELSQHNIERMVAKLKVDYINHVENWKEYRAHLKAMLKSNVVDIELLTDNRMNKLVLEKACKYRIRYIFDGLNTATEGISLPSNWAWNKLDGRNLRNILAKHSDKAIRLVKPIGILKYHFLRKAYNIKFLSPLNLIDYNKDEALNLLEKKYGYKKYPFKHFENIFTRVYQGYILPEKFGIDKRRLHLSSLIINGEISKSQGEELLRLPIYPDETLLKKDINFVKEKLDLNDADWEEIIRADRSEHDNYKTSQKLIGLGKYLFK